MNHHLTRILAIVAIVLGMFSTLNAAEPRMEKAIELLKQAQAASNPVPQLEKAMEHLQNATGNKAGFKVDAIKTIKEAIKKAKKGDNVRELIGKAIAQVQTGINAK
jgi:ABC-type branched-subunit amino acid transport system substrate-binding protein